MESLNLEQALSSADPVAYLMYLAPAWVRYLSTAFFVLAVFHTFCVKYFSAWAEKYPEGSWQENALHLLGEVEIVFGFWAAVLLLVLSMGVGGSVGVSYLEALNFREPIFVFVIMCVAATRPIIQVASNGIHFLAKLLPMPAPLGTLFSILFFGSLLGSYITEPAAMTLSAFLLREKLEKLSLKSKYTILGVLFVNVSIGGVLTPYAAPPVLMVASVWKWGAGFMLQNFGWKAIVACAINSAWACWACKNDLKETVKKDFGATPIWLKAIHLVVLIGVVLGAHHTPVFVGVFLLFLGLVAITKEHQAPLKIRESLLVGFFLAGLVVLGTLQRWWLEPLFTSLSPWPLYIGATALTAITDNAALTYLGAQVSGLSSELKYFLVSGAVVGGGLTVIANAPNPVGYSLLSPAFGTQGISPGGLFLAALLPTLVAFCCFGFF